MTNNPFENLVHLAEKHPDQIALVEPVDHALSLPRQWTYQDLVFETRGKIQSLKTLELEPQSRVGVLIRPELEFYSLTMACFALGLTPVFFDPKTASLPTDVHASQADFNLVSNSFFEPHWWKLLSFSRLFTFKSNLPFIRKLNGHRKGETAAHGYYSYNAKDTVCAFVKTADHTIEIDYESYKAQVNLFSTTLRPQNTELIFSPLLALLSLRQGTTCVLARTSEDRALEGLGIRQIKGTAKEVISLGKNLLQNRKALSSLKMIMIEGQKLSQNEARQIEDLFPHADLFHCFGLSEVEPIAMISVTDIHKAPAVGHVVGNAISTVQIEIVPTQMDLSKKNVSDFRTQEGEVVLTAPHLSFHKGHFAAFQDSENQSWIRTGILGYFGPDRNLYLIGHLEQQIQIGNRHYPLDLIEQQFETIPGVQKASLKKDAAKAHLFVTMSPEVEDAEAVSAVIEKYGIDFKLANLQIHAKKAKLAESHELPSIK
ncbi:MAG: AMP-binding protein [Pseudobdellovibrionaceae bacterium]